MKHAIPSEGQYENDSEILKQPKLADACFICTQDHFHYVPAMKAMELGYHVFLEKPMAVDPKECIELGKAADKNHVHLMIGHVLRYTPFFSTIKRLLTEGRIGQLVSIQHNENVGYWHQAHSFVRGNWGNLAKSSPMILAKSCHDLDLMIWFADSVPKKVSSFGSLSYFNAKNAPKGAPNHCMDGCPEQDKCPYFAPKVYLNAEDWMKLPVSNDMSDQGLLRALKKGPYGRCVFLCDNDVVDHQVTAIEFENQVTVAFTMTGFTHENTRSIKLMGTLGEIRGHMDKNEIEVYQFGKQKPEIIIPQTIDAGHGGGDFGIMKAFSALVESGAGTDLTSDKVSVESHLLAFAAEKSRIERKTIDFAKYVSSLGR
jgi:predicted dehydrogenase